MRIIFTIFYILCCFTFSFCQEKNNDFFFTKELDSLDSSWGRCIVPATWKNTTVESIISQEHSEIVRVEEYKYDTINLGTYIKNNPDALKNIIYSGDTSIMTIEVRKEGRLTIPCPTDTTCYELIPEEFTQNPAHQKWQLKPAEDNFKSTSWNLIYVSEKTASRIKKRMKYICCSMTREEVIPAHYVRISKVIPKEGIKNYETNNIKFLDEQKHIVKYSNTTFKKEILIPEKTKLISINKLITPARIELQKIIYSPSNKLITKLQKQLYALGLYQGNFLGEFDNDTKEAIIKYQLKHKLPFGQITEETVNHILSQETPFNK